MFRFTFHFSSRTADVTNERTKKKKKTTKKATTNEGGSLTNDMGKYDIVERTDSPM